MFRKVAVFGQIFWIPAPVLDENTFFMETQRWLVHTYPEDIHFRYLLCGWFGKEQRGLSGINFLFKVFLLKKHFPSASCQEEKGKLFSGSIGSRTTTSEVQILHVFFRSFILSKKNHRFLDFCVKNCWLTPKTKIGKI